MDQDVLWLLFNMQSWQWFFNFPVQKALNYTLPIPKVLRFDKNRHFGQTILSSNVFSIEPHQERFKLLLENKTWDLKFETSDTNVYLKGNSKPINIEFYHPASIELLCLWYNPPEYFRRKGINMHPNLMYNATMIGFLNGHVQFTTYLIMQYNKWSCFENVLAWDPVFIDRVEIGAWVDLDNLYFRSTSMTHGLEWKGKVQFAHLYTEADLEEFKKNDWSTVPVNDPKKE